MSRIKVYVALLLTFVLLLSFSSNPPQGRTGGPGEPTCASIGCHSGINIAIDGHIEIKGLPSQVQKDSVYNLSLDLIIDRGTPLRGGFQLMVLTSQEDNVGGFSNPGESSTISESNGRTYFEHDPARRFEGKDTLSYLFDWQFTDLFDTESIVFYAAANFANGDGGTTGDRIVTLKDTLEINRNHFIYETHLTPPSCNETNDGSISVEVKGGTPPYRYLWSTGDTSKHIQGLAADIYTLFVSDSENVIDSIEIELKTALDIIPPQITCITDTLRITSCAPFSYPRPVAKDNCDNVQVSLLKGKGPNQSFEPGLHLEIYEARDLQGNSSLCTIFVHNVNVINPDVTILNIPCYSDIYGSVNVKVSGDHPPYQISLLNDPAPLDRLKEGKYTLRITDQSGCQVLEIFEITRPDSLHVMITKIVHPQNSSSGDGAISVEVSGGTPPYKFNWKTEDEDFSSDQNLKLLFPGAYTLVATDRRGCSVISDTIRLDAITSIIDQKISSSIFAHPNPATDYFNITIDQNLKIKRTYILDLTGRTIQTNFSDFFNINVSHLSDGIYFILIEIEDGRRGLIKFFKS